MSKGYFTDKHAKPEESGIRQVIGKSCTNWEVLNTYLTSDLKLKGEYKFYGVNYGWALRFSKSGKSLIALYPGVDNFMIQIILNSNQVEQALNRITNRQLLKVIRETESIHEGKWIYLPVTELTDLQDVFTLITIRMKIK